MKKHLPTLLVILMLFIGFSLLFYPDISTWWNSRIHAGVVDQYREAVEGLSPEFIANQFAQAYTHNAELAELPTTSSLRIGEMATLPDNYNRILNVGGVMGRIEIPKIGVDLPIYHTTSYHVLNRGVGHLEGTAFPTGGYGNHTALTAHSGLPNATLFTDLEGNIVPGDYFFIDVLDRRLAYRVDLITTVWPFEVEGLRVVPGADLVTLITCTPYALNTHRLLVRGYRVPYIPAMAEEIQVEQSISNRVDMRVYIFLGFFALFILGFIIYQILTGNKKATTELLEELEIPMTPITQPLPQTQMPIIETTQNPAADYVEIPPTPVFIQPEPSHDTISLPTGQTAPITNEMYNDPRDNPTSPWVSHSPMSLEQITPATGSLLEQYIAKAKENNNSTRKTIAAASTKTDRPLYKRPDPKSKKLNLLHKIKANRNIVAAFIATLVVITIGIGILFARPQIATAGYQSAIDGFISRIEDFREAHHERVVAEMMARWHDSGELVGQDIESLNEDPFAELLRDVQEYNRRISNGSQPILQDPFSYNQTGFNLDYFGFDEDMIGFVTIPSLDAQLPIFLGASEENLQRGLAHLTGTSIPVGGESTNAVIAGHMTSGRSTMLAGVDTLGLGDEITITNFYDTLRYEVINIQMVYPSQTEALKIQNGSDMITLLAYQEGYPQRHMITAQRIQ